MNNGYVIKLTGKLFDIENVDRLVKIAETVKEYSGRYRFILVCGGGGTLRKWLSKLRESSSASEYDLDMLGIAFTRLNADILRLMLKPYSIDYIPESIEEVLNLIHTTNKIIVLGGISPGFSTNAVAAFIAKELGYVLINMTSAGGVYDRDPSKYSEARIIDEIHIEDLIRLLSDRVEHAGSYPLFDMTSLNLIKNYKISTYVIGPDQEQLIKIFDGGSSGTRIII